MRTGVAVATLGVFDGMHRGHQRVLERARHRADAAGARLAVYTFDAHPLSVLSREGSPRRLSLLDEKVTALRAAGADRVRVLDFTPRLAARAPLDFLRAHVFPDLRLAGLVVGYDFALGRDRAGTVPLLRSLGIRFGYFVEAVGPETDGDGPVSSSRIRAALGAGDVGMATRLLGHPYRLGGVVGTGDGRGRELGFPTANLAVDPQKVRPARGVYAVRVTGAAPETLAGVLNVGRRPTFGEGEETVEVHVLDFREQLAGRPLTLELIARLRDERRFSTPAELADQIRQDVEAGRRILEGETGETSAGTP